MAMYELYNGKTLVAESTNNGTIKKIRDPVPILMFRDGNEVSINYFLVWLNNRVFPPNRLDIKELLEKFGLKKYDAFTLAVMTEARQPWKDNFWFKYNKKEN